MWCSAGIGSGTGTVPVENDWVLRGVHPSGLSIVCYAVYTLVSWPLLAQRESKNAAADLATLGVATVVQTNQQLGFEVVLHKAEAKCLHGRS